MQQSNYATGNITDAICICGSTTTHQKDVTGEIETMQLNDECNEELQNNFGDEVGNIILRAVQVLKKNEDKLPAEDEHKTYQVNS